MDFCSGAGGPTPFVEREINGRLRQEERGRHGQLNGIQKGEGDGVEVVLTDLHPHAPAWKEASARSEGGWLGFVDGSVDAARAGKEVLKRVTWGQGKQELRGGDGGEEKKLFRLFSLAFHHFDDGLATDILRNTLQNSEGFAIFELQGRDVGNLFTVLAMLPVLLASSWWWYWGDWWHLFFTYVVPVVPFVVVYDGLVSCLRTRRENEVFALLRKAGAGIEGGLEGWRFEVSEQVHTWPVGMISYFIGVKDSK